MWIFLWLVLSSILIGFTLWSLQILLKQKQAWESYAKSKNLTFVRGKLMANAEMSGAIGDYRVGFFTAVRAGDDIRTRKYVTVLEVGLAEGLVDGVAAGSALMLPFLQTLDKLHPFTPPIEGWDANYPMFARNDAAVSAYLTPERGEALLGLLKTKNADVLIVLNDEQVIIRLETADPMKDAAKIDKIVKRVTGLIDKLRITPEQRESYKTARPAAPPAKEGADAPVSTGTASEG